MRIDEYKGFDGIGLGEIIATGEVTRAEVSAAARKIIDEKNPSVNAVVSIFAVDAPEAGRAIQKGSKTGGPFDGVPFLLKDYGQYLANVPTTGGSRLFVDDVRSEDSTLVKRYRNAGLVFHGKTNTPELALCATTEPVLFGPTRNPVKLSHSAGGSSGGAAAAVASGMTPIAHASDGGGSIRIPASCCGLVGLKPSRGRVPCGPQPLEGWGGLSTIHAVTRTVRDTAALLDISSGPELGSPYYAPTVDRSFLEASYRDPSPLKLALRIDSFSGGPVDPEVATLAQHALAACSDLGHHVVDHVLDVDPEVIVESHSAVALSHIAANIDARLEKLGRELRKDDVEASTWRSYQLGGSISGKRYAHAIQSLHQQARQLAAFFASGIDILVTPTLAGLPLPLGKLDMMSDDVETFSRLFDSMIGFTAFLNDAGVPAISLPLGWSSQGLPVGVQFIGAYGEEALLLSLAGQLERAGLFMQQIG